IRHMQLSQTATIGLVLNGEALVVRFFPNSARSPTTRLKVLVHDGLGIWLAARRLNEQGSLRLQIARSYDRVAAETSI
ncbi:hypothetical protein, partial [Pseudomonas savastanoi]|uniref:hypothetical protein n=1 Tax=Pseudomonas savastanoi TaxID=29438 RepID=UPI001969E70A